MLREWFVFVMLGVFKYFLIFEDKIVVCLVLEVKESVWVDLLIGFVRVFVFMWCKNCGVVEFDSIIVKLSDCNFVLG